MFRSVTAVYPPVISINNVELAIDCVVEFKFEFQFNVLVEFDELVWFEVEAIIIGSTAIELSTVEFYIGTTAIIGTIEIVLFTAIVGSTVTIESS